MAADIPQCSNSSTSALKDLLVDLMGKSVDDYAIILLDPAGYVVSWNVGAQRILQYTAEEIVGHHFSRFFLPEDIQAGKPQHELKEATTRGVGQDENWLVRKDGTSLYGSGSTSCLRDTELRGFAKIFRDLTTQRRLEEEASRRADELAAADRRKDEFLAMLSHELRNPLAPVMNALQILRQSRLDDPVLQQASSVIERQVRHMTRLIDDLLDVTRINRGKVQLRQEKIELGVVLQRAVETTKPLIESRNHHLSLSLPSEAIWLDADPARLEQVVSNLLSNAAKYTESGGRIWLAAAAHGRRAVITVRDNGVGISPDLLPRVFDLFTQADRTLDRAQGGLGIGLTLVKSLMEMHGGSAAAYSDGLGRGSMFTIEMPTSDRPLTAQSELPVQVDAPPASLRVLVVDDNMDTADTLSLLLRLRGYETQTANDGLKALDAALAFLPDVILLDIGLPGADGYQVAQRVRQLPGLQNVVLVAMTGYGQESDRVRSQDAGFDHHMVKPADLDKLQQLLAMLAARCTGD
jgi:PAS domain S-box-containing protein